MHISSFESQIVSSVKNGRQRSKRQRFWVFWPDFLMWSKLTFLLTECGSLRWDFWLSYFHLYWWGQSPAERRNGGCRWWLFAIDIIPSSCSRHLVHLILILHPGLQWHLVPPAAFPGLPPELSPLQAKFQLLLLLFLCHPFTQASWKLPNICLLMCRSSLVLSGVLWRHRDKKHIISQNHGKPEAQSFCRFSHSVNILYSNYLTFHLIFFKRIMRFIGIRTVILYLSEISVMNTWCVLTKFFTWDNIDI